ncbi:hypothetical protein NMG60_11016582 [Bertholletia excelsa]
MEGFSGLLTSAAINIGLCAVCFSLYSILRKQPSNVSVYFPRRLAQLQAKQGRGHFSLDRFFPSAGWLLKAWEATEKELLASGGLDGVAFLRMIILSIHIFSISAVVCLCLVLPMNYFGNEMRHSNTSSVSLVLFTIAKVKEGSKWLWAHCCALYILSFSTCALLYFEYKKLTTKRLAYIAAPSFNPSHFTILVRGIPWSGAESYSDLLRNFFTNYHASTYLAHQMVYQPSAVKQLVRDAAKAKEMPMFTSIEQDHSHLKSCGICGATTHSFKIHPRDSLKSDLRKKECAAALVFFRTRHAALVASRVLQSANPMSWVTEMAPEPHDIYWKNVCLPYRQIWIRKLSVLLASLVFSILFIFPLFLIQGLHLFIARVVTGYLPSALLMLFLYAVPPIMMLFSTFEGSISRSARKRSACIKVLCFMIWNVFFYYVMTGQIMERLALISSPKDITTKLAAAVPTQATFFMSYVMTSGWASLASELLQPYVLIYNFVNKFILRNKDESACLTYTFPYQTEISRVLLFGFLGFTYSIMAPLILPFLLVYFFLAYFVYRNQILNVYVTKYQSGGKFWPTIHSCTIFSLVMMQVIAMGVFGLKKSTMASALTVPLIICTLLFHQYCRKRFLLIFKEHSAEVLIEMDRRDEQSGMLEEIYQQLRPAYCQFALASEHLSNKTVPLKPNGDRDDDIFLDEEDNNSGKAPTGL